MFTESYIQESHYISSDSDSDTDSFLRCKDEDSDEGSDEHSDEGSSTSEHKDDDGVEDNCGEDFIFSSPDYTCRVVTGTHTDLARTVNCEHGAKSDNKGLPRQFNDYEIGHVRSSSAESEQQVVGHGIWCAVERDRREQFDREVDAHAISMKYSEYKNKMNSSEKADMKSSRHLWFDEMR